jgi:aromatic-amino-acid transaminase
VVAQILGDPALKALWVEEVEAMRQRIAELRQGLVEALAPHGWPSASRTLPRNAGCFPTPG